MVVATTLTGVGWVVSPIITKVLNEGFDFLGETNIKDRLRNLETTILPKFQLVIEAAEKTEQKTEMGLWLRKLKDALCEAEDVLDLYKYQLLEEKVNDLNSNLTAKFYSKFVGNLSCQKIKLRRSLEKLEKIAAGADEFRKLLKMQNESSSATHDSNGGQQPNFTDSIPSQVFGRDKERDDIIDKYLLDPSVASESEKCYSVVAIVGIGGAGKTTLAQQICNDKRLEKEFDIKMWISVSHRLDVLKHTREMIVSASGGECPHLENPDTLKHKLIDLIKLKKVLLILDDVWYANSKDEEKWDNLLEPLAIAGKRGSRILITTRTMNLPEALHPRYSMMLQDLEEDAILSLFKHHAFYRANLNNSDMQMELEDIGKKIVKKLHGSQLSKKLEANYWKETLEGDNLCDTRGALLWSYQRLDAPLQRCFSYFSLFPKGTRYSSEEIIHMWIAQGFVTSLNDSTNSTRMEDIGRKYFDELVSNSFLQGQDDHDVYHMHDLFHDLAENISKEDCLRLEDEPIEIPLTIRHLYVSDESLEENITSLKKLKKLRTLIIYASVDFRVIDHIFASTINKYKKLRVLCLKRVSVETLPESIGDLKHLRYLDLHKNYGLVGLPASLGKLYHLQLLSLPSPCKGTLPRSLKNLIYLRHFKKDYEALALPYIGRLTSLQAVNQFDVKKEKGYDIGQLKNLNEIRGRLTISYLENVEGKDKAAEAGLKNKKHLESLCLAWDNYDDDSECRRDLDLEVLEGLQPHPNLTNLIIEGYKPLGYPRWLLQEGCLQNLRSLHFHKCTGLEVLPDMKKLFPHCHKLEIWRLPNLKKFPLLPQSLKILEISHCPSLVFIPEEDLQEGQEKIELILPSLLQKLKIQSCDITDRELSQLLRSLASLKCLKFEEINRITTLPSKEVLQHLTSLTELEIIGCSQLKSLGGLFACSSLEILQLTSVPSLELEILASREGGGILSLLRSLIRGCKRMMGFEIAGDLPNLYTLWLGGIPSLASLSMSSLTALRALTIRECSLLSSLSNLPDSLKDLCLDSCSCILSLPEHLPKSLDILNLQKCPGILSLPEHLPGSLSQLWLLDCPGISSLPNLPKSLKIIAIFMCPVLEEKCRSPDGEFWPKIAHIPERRIHTGETDL